MVSEMGEGRGRIAGFDGLRAVAIAFVVLYHLGAFRALGDMGLANAGTPFVLGGDTGVRLFMALSGFLITHLLLVENAATGRIDVPAFLGRRFLRIVPPYAVMVAVTAAVAALVPGTATPAALFHAATLTANFVSVDSYSPALGHAWSLAVEEHFYLIWPPVLAACAASRRRLLAACTGSACLAGIAATWATSGSGPAEAYFVHRWTPLAVAPILAGCAMALFLADGATGPALRRALRGPMPLAAAIAMAAHPALLGGNVAFVSLALRTLGLAAVVGWVAANQDARIVRLLDVPALRSVGVLSYSIYVWQNVLIVQVTGMPASDLALCLLLAAVTHAVVERPILRRRREHGGSASYRSEANRINDSGQEGRIALAVPEGGK